MRRAKDVETLIEALPSKNDSAERVSYPSSMPTDAQASRLSELQQEMAQANAEYKEALGEAEALLQELRAALKLTLGDGTERNVPSLKGAVAAM